jgi:hypothetical protein
VFCPPTSSSTARPICPGGWRNHRGSVDFTRRVAFYDIAPAGNVDVISSSPSDTATKITYYGRELDRCNQNQTLTLNGRTWVTGSQVLERLLYASLSGATVNGAVANPGAPLRSVTWH